MYVKIDRKKLPCVETEGTVLCTTCGNSYQIEPRQKLHSIIVTTCPHCGHQNINVVTNSVKFIEEVLSKIDRLRKDLMELKKSLEIEMQQNGFVDNYPEVFKADDEKQAEPKLL
ncbi:conserved hypothetical protein [Thermotoga petrophila RKU-10]|jgi:transcription elongation factor Elf1|uniref:Uncharacterized protein n=2 Tax=Thermotoga petrophila TaxID=93929 RepID=A5IM49_THEP1|nr:MULTISPECIES: hypothetical protein [Thermotoga]ABQ47272.1 hypothetical protein Tpet_1258 [Thermotoga petrophila RKU-1]ADA67359.1 conserved hypothetical protein [Thermotoga petrophila RKU-10]AIY86734.1 hypothetical protein T2812B_06005 [Thermotoga sp. 2812B]EJX25452.1 hypothetical protein EMP_06652 [Thermotoga sp. EMP]KAF2960561.1 hypothetical protein AS158_02595 [Thermotoga sp. 38H-to]